MKVPDWHSPRRAGPAQLEPRQWWPAGEPSRSLGRSEARFCGRQRRNWASQLLAEQELGLSTVMNGKGNGLWKTERAEEACSCSVRFLNTTSSPWEPPSTTTTGSTDYALVERKRESETLGSVYFCLWCFWREKERSEKPKKMMELRPRLLVFACDKRSGICHVRFISFLFLRESCFHR